MKRLVLIFGAAFIVGLSGVAAATVFSGSSPPSPSSGKPSESERPSQEDAGIHGGPIDRFQQANRCNLTALSGLPENWTHGDYVSAVASGGDVALIQQAAHSDCGKPIVAVGHGGGPPAHALANMAAGQAHAEGSDERSDAAETAGPPGS